MPADTKLPMLMRPNIIGRYLFVEVLRTWLVVAGVLLFLTLGLGFAKFIADAAAGELPVDTVLLLALFSTIQNAGIVLPISVLLAVLLTLGRLCRDNEMAAMLAGGASFATVYRPFIVLSLLVVVFAGFLSLAAAPHATRTIEQLTAQTTATALRSLAPERFLSLLNGRAVFYAQGRDAESGHLSDVFIRVLRRNQAGKQVQSIVTAERAVQQTDPETGAQILVLKNGWRYEGRPGQAGWRLVHFAEHGVRVALNNQAAGSHDIEAVTTRALWQRDNPSANAQLQIRLSVPLAILILTLLALPLGRLPPRAGRYGRIIIGILLYVVYFNLLHIATVWVESGVIPAIVGVWPVHLAMLLLALGLMMRDRGVFVRKALS